MHFISLRIDSHAQYEIRAYAEVMLDTLKRWVPMTHEAFSKYHLGGFLLSAPALAVVKALLAGEAINQEDSNLSKREWNELMEALGRVSL